MSSQISVRQPILLKSLECLEERRLVHVISANFVMLTALGAMTKLRVADVHCRIEADLAQHMDHPRLQALTEEIRQLESNLGDAFIKVG